MPDPLDLARWRALVSDTERVILTACADIIERQGDGAVRYIGARVDEVREPLTALTTALRATCDEVEKLREVVSAADAVARKKLRKFWKEHDVCLNCGRLKPLKSERPPLMLDYEEAP